MALLYGSAMRTMTLTVTLLNHDSTFGAVTMLTLTLTRPDSTYVYYDHASHDLAHSDYRR